MLLNVQDVRFTALSILFKIKSSVEEKLACNGFYQITTTIEPYFVKPRTPNDFPFEFKVIFTAKDSSNEEQQQAGMILNSLEMLRIHELSMSQMDVRTSMEENYVKTILRHFQIFY